MVEMLFPKEKVGLVCFRRQTYMPIVSQARGFLEAKGETGELVEPEHFSSCDDHNKDKENGRLSLREEPHANTQ